jgi:alkaline phosphatase
MKTVKGRIAFLCVLIYLLFNSTISCLSDESYEGRKAVALDINEFKYPADFNLFPVISGKKVKNVILLIGDGMGPGAIVSSRVKATGAAGALNFERFPVTGIVKNYSANALITDSAAAATALASGIKTSNGMVGMSPRGENYKTILEAAKEKGFRTGLVATSTITHATPACFAAHIKSRNSEAAIAEQLVASKVNVLFGGGQEFFTPRGTPGSRRRDDKNIISQAKDLGYTYIEDGNNLQAVKGDYILGLFALAELSTIEPEPRLSELAQKAIDVLSEDTDKSAGGILGGLFNAATLGLFDSDDDGFFLMVEGSQIDFAAHLDDTNDMIRQTLLFDEAVKKAVDFAMNDKHTLVLVTADHDTGGPVVTAGRSNGRRLTIRWASKDHTATPVFIYAFGPGSQKFTGTMDNTEIPKKIATLLKIKEFPLPLIKAN